MSYPPQRSRKARLVALAAVVVAGAGVASAWWAIGRDSDADKPAQPSPSARSTSPTTSASTAPGAADMERAVNRILPELEAFTSAQRGLPFKEPVDLTVLPPDEFKTKLLEGNGPVNVEEVKDAEGLLRALRLLEPGIDLAAAAEDAIAEGVVGFYSAETKELYVRGVAVTPFVRKVIVHELTHALQDQHFGLTRPELDAADDERPDAFQAVVEGDATRIENLYLDSLTTADRVAALREEDELSESESMGNVPEIVGALLALPYAAGEPFVRAVVNSGGQARLDDAFRDPPANLEQILHPEKFLAAEIEARVPPPEPDGEAFDEGVLGEPALQFVLSQLITEAEAFAASGGWGGDRYVAWKEGERVCFRLRISMDTRVDAGELTAALRKWTDVHGNAVVESTQPILLRACES